MTAVVLSTSDGDALDIQCAPGQSVLEAAAEAGIALPASCGNGTCGSCHAIATEGKYHLSEHAEQALPPADEERGGVLLCCTYPRGPLAIDLPYDRSRIIFGEIPMHTGTIAELEPAARDTLRLVVQLDPAASQFEPGQFVDLEIPGRDVRRSYSMANTGNWDGRLEFFIRLRPGGLFSSYLRDEARVGDELTVRGPQGAFGLRETGMRPRLFIAGGSGLAPLLSMVRWMVELQEPQPARLLFGVNEAADVFGRPELDEAAAKLPGFRYEICHWRDGVTPLDLLPGSLADRPDVYVCGPPQLVDGVLRLAAEHGLDPERVFRERFLAT
jgi:ferredoxin-NADP reductase/ferredoxin